MQKILFVLLLGLVLALSACGKSTPKPDPDPVDDPAVIAATVNGYNGEDGDIRAMSITDPNETYGTGTINADGEFEIELDELNDDQLVGFDTTASLLLGKQSLKGRTSAITIGGEKYCEDVIISNTDAKFAVVPVLIVNVDGEDIGYMGQSSDLTSILNSIGGANLDSIDTVEGSITVRLYVDQDVSVTGGCTHDLDIDDETLTLNGTFDVDLKTGWNYVTVSVDGNLNISVVGGSEDLEWYFLAAD
jgi:hypothetical protein